MAIELIMEPNTPAMCWRRFRQKAPRHAIAIDGYVKAGPRYDPRREVLNLNHHEEVSRLETRATCAQATMLIRQGLYRTFRNARGNAEAFIYANDCDEDVCLTYFVLRNPDMAMQTQNPALNRLVHMEDMLDTTAGGYPFPTDMPSMSRLNWVFQPYRRFRADGGLEHRDAEMFAQVVYDVGRRIWDYIVNGGEELELDTRYEVAYRGAVWSLVRETGMNARSGVFGDGIDAFVSVRERDDGRYTYSVGRQSLFVPFDVPAILAALDAEDDAVGDSWGGSDIIGGSPRTQGSGLSPDRVVEIVNQVLDRSAASSV